MKIYLSDLTHTGKGIHASTFPLGMAYVAAYAKQELGDEYDIEVFKFPQDLSEAIIKNPPEILSFSNYSWNFELGYKFASLAKEKFPDIITIFGGPNFPVNPAERKEFLEKRNIIDFYIQNEGEIGFVNLIRKINEYGFDVKKLKQSKESVINCIYLSGNQLVEGEFQRILNLETIPSPYLTGVLDKFFAYPIVPMFETTRGCPFSCTFCADGLISKSRIARFPSERSKAELKYIVERVKNVDELIITDLNFGMYKEDVQTAKNIAEIQEKYGWPIVFHASLGKNNKEQVMEVASILKGSLVMGAAIQSADPEVLKNIKRNNISLEAYRGFLEFGNNLSKDALTFTEIILGLPGDNKSTHFKSLRYGIENGARTVRMYQAMLLSGTEMASKKTRDEHKLLTRFRVIPGGVGIYTFDGKSFPVAELEEIIVGSKDLTFEEYISCRVMNLLIETYFNNALFLELFLAIEQLGVSHFEALAYLHQHTEFFSPKIKKIIDNFILATRDDLYATYEEAQNYVLNEDIVNKFISGELGINELLVHRAELFLELEEISKAMFNSVKQMLTEKGLFSENLESYLDQLIKFMLCKKQKFYEFDKEIVDSFNYDFKSIDEMGYKVDPRTLNSGNYQFKFYHNNDQKKHIKNTFGIYINTPSGIGRFLQRSNLKKMYRCFDYQQERAAA